MTLRKSHENPSILKIYEEYYDHPLSPLAEEMLHTGQVRLNNCKSQRTGRNYSCILNLTAEEDGRSHFEMSFDNLS